MKKLLLSILCLFSIIAVRADEVTFDFTNPSQLTPAITDAMFVDGGNDALKFPTSETTFNQNGVTINTTDGSTESRIWKTAKGVYNLRIYKTATMTIAAPENGTITSIAFAGTTVANFAADNGTIEDKTWSGSANSVVFTWDGSAKTQNINTITVTYTVVEQGVAAPQASLSTGTIYNPADVELTAEAGTIYYTLDGTEPTAESAVYESPISIKQFGTTTTIKAIAIDGAESSKVATFSYTLKVATPVANYNTGVYDKLPLSFTDFTCETEGASVIAIRVSKYTTDVKTQGSKYFTSPYRNQQNEYHIIASVTQDGEKVWSDSIVKKYYLSSIAPFKKATSIVSGTKYLINANSIIANNIYDDETYGYLNAKTITKKNDYIETNEYYGFTFEETENAGEYYIIDVFNRYLYMQDTYNSFNVSADNSELGDDAVWTVSFNEDGAAIITNKGKNKTIQFSTKYNSFGSYDTISNANVLPTLYAQSVYPTFTVTANGETEDGMTYKSFTGITITCEAGIELMEETDELSPRYLIGMEGTEPQWFNFGEQIDEYTIVYNLETEITESETYSVTIPAGAFTLDPNGLAMTSESSWINVTIDNRGPFSLVGVTPESGCVVDEMSEIWIEYNRDIYDNLWGVDIVATDEEGNEYIFKLNEDWENSPGTNYLGIVAKKTIKKAGTYTLTIGADWAYCYNSNYMMSYIAEDVTYTFTVTGNNYVEGEEEEEEEEVVTSSLAITSITPENGSNVESVDRIIIAYNQEITDNIYGKVAVTDENGNVTNFEITYTAADGDFAPWNEIHLVTDTPITAAGTYSLTISKDWAYIWVMGTGKRAFIGEDIEYTFTIGESTAIDKIENAESEQTIFDITGRQIKEITAPGIYIINGVKTIVK